MKLLNFFINNLTENGTKLYVYVIISTNREQDITQTHLKKRNI